MPDFSLGKEKMLQHEDRKYRIRREISRKELLFEILSIWEDKKNVDSPKTYHWLSLIFITISWRKFTKIVLV